MLIFITWIVLSVLVGIAANSRSRNGIGWTLLALLVSPIIAIIVLLVMPNLADEADVTTKSFPSSGAYKGIPYRKLSSGMVEAMMPGGRVCFANEDQFRAAARGEDVEMNEETLSAFPQEHNGIRYRVDSKGRVESTIGSFSNWESFWRAVN